MEITLYHLEKTEIKMTKKTEIKSYDYHHNLFLTILTPNIHLLQTKAGHKICTRATEGLGESYESIHTTIPAFKQEAELITSNNET